MQDGRSRQSGLGVRLRHAREEHRLHRCGERRETGEYGYVGWHWLEPFYFALTAARCAACQSFPMLRVLALYCLLPEPPLWL